MHYKLKWLLSLCRCFLENHKDLSDRSWKTTLSIVLSSVLMMFCESIKHVALWRYALIGAITLTLPGPFTHKHSALPPPPFFLSISSLSFSASLISSMLNSANSGQECPNKLVKVTSKLPEMETNRFNLPAHTVQQDDWLTEWVSETRASVATKGRKMYRIYGNHF